MHHFCEWLKTFEVEVEKSPSILILIVFLITACSPANISTNPKPNQEPTISTVLRVSPIATSSLPNTSTPQVSDGLLATPTSTPFPEKKPFPYIEPVIHDQTGDLYETIFSIPIDKESIFQYEELPGAIFGPNGMAMTPDGTFIISYHTTSKNLLVYVDQKGSIIKTIDLDDLGISLVTDLRFRDDILYLLEITNEGRYKIHYLLPDGSLIDSEEIPADFPSSSGEPLARGEVSIAIDCELNVLMEVEGGYKVYRFSDVLKNPNPIELDEGIPCNGKYYSVLAGDPSLTNIKAGEINYQTRLTTGFGGLSFLDVLADGSFYVVRNDVVSEQAIQMDQTIHYVGADGAVRGLARVPLSEFFYSIRRNVVTSPSTGEVFVLLPRPDSLDVVRLNFYKELPPLKAGGVSPELSVSNMP
jgi:hypothetical protein